MYTRVEAVSSLIFMYVAVWKCPDTVDNGIARLLFGSSFCFLHPLGSWRSNLERDSACAKDREICQAAFGKARGVGFCSKPVLVALFGCGVCHQLLCNSDALRDMEHCIMSQCITLHDTSSHFISLCCVTARCISYVRT